MRFVGQDQRDEVGRSWRAIEAEHDVVAVMRSWAWVDAWTRFYASAVDTRFAIVEDGDEVVATMLVTGGVVRRGPVPVRVIWLGTADLSVGQEACPEHNGIVARPGREDEVVGALLTTLLAERSWDELRLRGFAAEDAEPFLRRWPASQTLVEREPSPAYDIGAVPDDEPIHMSLRRSSRRTARRTLKAFERRGPVSIDWADDPDEACAILDELIALHQARWNARGLPGAFAGPRFTGMHRDLVRTLAPEGRVLLARVRCGDETVACAYNFIDGDRVLCYQFGWRQYDENALRSGVLCDLVLMEEARRRGYRCYDLLPGDLEYKRALANTEGELLRVVLRRPRLRFRAIALLQTLRAQAQTTRDRARSGVARLRSAPEPS